MLRNRPRDDAGQRLSRLGSLVLAAAVSVALGAADLPAQDPEPGAPGAAYRQMPAIAPIGVRPDRYLPVSPDDEAPPVNPAKGYRLQQLGRGLYMVTDNVYQSMFLVYETGVVVVDAPPSYSKKLRQAIAEVTDRPVTHAIYSHAHSDHIAGVNDLGAAPTIIAHEETRRLLERAADPNRPVPGVTFQDRYVLETGSQTLELSYHGVAHQPGNIFIWAAEQETLMVVDVVFPGWMPWRRFALAQDIPGYFHQVAEIDDIPFKYVVGGHVGRVGSHADVRAQLDFMEDLKTAASTALQTTELGGELDPRDGANPWAVFDNYIDRVVVQCVNALGPKWQSRLRGYDVYIWDQCYAMEQSLRID